MVVQCQGSYSLQKYAENASSGIAPSIRTTFTWCNFWGFKMEEFQTWDDGPRNIRLQTQRG